MYKLSITIFLILISKNIFAVNNVYVICVNPSLNWNWLIVNNKYVTVDGSWLSAEKYYHTFKYFKPITKIDVKELQIKCRKLYGESYIYAQPTESHSRSWYLFGNDTEDLSLGFSTFCTKKSFELFSSNFNCLIRENKDK